MRVNTLKALPVLQYLLAEDGLEAPAIPFGTGWAVYKKFLRVPADSSEDVAGFQVSWLRENPEQPVLELLLCRQLRDEALSVGPLRRVVALQFLFEGARVTVDEGEVWSSECGSVDRFLDRVEHEPAFEYAWDANLSSADALIVQEE